MEVFKHDFLRNYLTCSPHLTSADYSAVYCRFVGDGKIKEIYPQVLLV